MSRALGFTIVMSLIVVIGVVVLAGRRTPDPSTAHQAADNPASDDRATGDQAVAATTPLPAEPTFVGRQVCRQCHAENFRLHAQHGHASTFATTRDSQLAKTKFNGKTFDSGESHGSYTYHVDDDGLHTRLADKHGGEPFALQYAFGSGHFGITLLSLLPDQAEGTIGIEHRVSWFSEDDQLSLTPGHDDKVPSNDLEFFGDSIRGEKLQDCVFCHTTTGRIVEQDIVDLTANVNCEKCHGPGSEHVQQAKKSRTPPPFSVGRADWNMESELNLCGRCHRMPKDRPAKELREYPDLLVRFQPIGILRSECYLESDGKFMCTTCHNPHMSSKERPRTEYVQQCIKCHVEDSQKHVACPVSPKEGCIECHMPEVKFDHGIMFHDHWIRVRE